MNVIGVCAGNGVMVHPFKDDLVFNFEPRSIYSTLNEIQWYLNFHCKKINKPPELHSLNIDVLIGHPDCGHSSMMSLSRIKKFTDPKDNESLTIFFWAIHHFKPKIWLMENLTKMLETLTWREIRQQFPEYVFWKHEGSVSDFGNSQKTRKRLVIIGIRRDLRKYKKLIKVFPVNELKKTSELLSNIQGSGHIKENVKEVITLYAGYKDSLTNIQKRWIGELQNKTRWPVEGRNFQNAPGVYKNLAEGYPATARKQNRQFNPQGDQMSPRELARIQGIPDTFEIWVDDNKVKTSINKGRVSVTKCPPYEIGVWFKEVLNILVANGFPLHARTHNIAHK